MPDEFIIIARSDGGGNDICLGIKSIFYGKIYIRADDSYLYKIADNFSDFINSLYKIALKESNVIGKYSFREVHDKYSLSKSTHFKRYSNLITNFFAEAPNIIKEYIIEYIEESKEITLSYFCKNKQIYNTQNFTFKDRINNSSIEELRNK